MELQGMVALTGSACVVDAAGDPSGIFPQIIFSMKSLSSLTTLYLQNNQFSGPIDDLASLPLQDLNVANNQFTGWIPDQLKKINSLQTDGNQWSSGPAPPPPPYMPPPSGRRINPGQGSGGSKSPSKDSVGGKKSGIGGGGVAGIIISLLVIGAIVAFFLVKRKKRISSTVRTQDSDHKLSRHLPQMKSKVLDETDRLLNIDFEKAIDDILKAIPRERRTYLFSATMTNKVIPTSDIYSLIVQVI